MVQAHARAHGTLQRDRALNLSCVSHSHAQVPAVVPLPGVQRSPGAAGGAHHHQLLKGPLTVPPWHDTRRTVGVLARETMGVHACMPMVA